MGGLNEWPCQLYLHAPLSFSILNDVDVKSEKVCTVNPGALFFLCPSILKHEGKSYMISGLEFWLYSESFTPRVHRR